MFLRDEFIDFATRRARENQNLRALIGQVGQVDPKARETADPPEDKEQKMLSQAPN